MGVQSARVCCSRESLHCRRLPLQFPPASSPPARSGSCWKILVLIVLSP
ncbi:hypothetical protein SLEP1_g19402 [Rubroshorea leprosula]|nr:hypothetical protein SLEP1_g19402 [Rubroshorea leprosula]